MLFLFLSPNFWYARDVGNNKQGFPCAQRMGQKLDELLIFNGCLANKSKQQNRGGRCVTNINIGIKTGFPCSSGQCETNREEAIKPSPVHAASLGHAIDPITVMQMIHRRHKYAFCVRNFCFPWCRSGKRN